VIGNVIHPQSQPIYRRMNGRRRQRRSRPTSRKRLKGMKMAAERRLEVMSRKFF
jgi:hypothetical protein